MVRYTEFGTEIKRRFSKCIAQGSQRDTDSREMPTIELNFDEPTKIDTLVTMEDIEDGQRIKKYIIEAYLDGKYREVVKGSSIGHKKIDEIQPISTKHVRIKVQDSFARPKIRSFTAYCCIR